VLKVSFSETETSTTSCSETEIYRKSGRFAILITENGFYILVCLQGQEIRLLAQDSVDARILSYI
jgi:hypothetical protein